MSFEFQVVVLGGGPSGARTAQRLAAGGASVLLLEAEGPEVDNLCSGLLNPEGQAALGCDLPQHVRRAPFRPRLELHDVDNRLRRRYDPRYWNMDRRSFDAWLRECAVEAGARVEYHRRASRITSLERGAVVRVGSDELRAAVVVDATGWRALSRRGKPATHHVHAFQGCVRNAELAEDSMWAVFRSGVTPYYGWLVPKGEGVFLLGAGYPQGAAQTRRSGDEAAVSDAEPWRKLAYLCDYVAAQSAPVDLLDAKPLGCPITTIESVGELWWGEEAVLPVGEAAGLVSPSSGDGIHFGLEHANALAAELLTSDCITEGLDSSEHAALTARIKRRLRPALTELRFNCLKARVASKPLARGLATQLLPLYLRRPVERLAFT